MPSNSFKLGSVKLPVLQLLVFSCSHPGCACGNALCWERQLHPAGSATLPLLYLIPFLLNVTYVDVTKPFLFLFFNYFSEGEEQELSHYGAECQGRGISPSRMGSVWHRGDTAP